jgi:hypothetical protein
MTDLDLSSLWSWTVPLWGIFIIVVFLGGVLMKAPVVQSSVAAVTVAAMSGGFRPKKRVRWAQGV